jgi:hypothetical protein
MVSVVTSSGGRYLSDYFVNSHEAGVFHKLGDDFTRAYTLGLTRCCSDRHEALLGGSVYPVGDMVEGLYEIVDGEGFVETSTPFVSLPNAFTWVFLSSLVSSAGALPDNSSAEMSSKYQLGRVHEGHGVSPAAMKTWRSGVPRPKSVVATSVEVCSSVGSRGVPSWKRSESR